MFGNCYSNIEFEEHSACHKASCFKKGCECRFLFPFMSNTSTYIHEDKGVQNENEILWYSLDGSTREICPFMVIPRRPMGCQYINPHNSPILNQYKHTDWRYITSFLQHIIYKQINTRRRQQKATTNRACCYKENEKTT